MNGIDGAFTRHLDEALRVLELRRYRRILASGRLPVIYSAAVFLFAGVLIPLFLGEGGLLADGAARSRAWGAGILLTVSALAAGLAGFFRAQHLWQGERENRTLQSWLLTRQNPARAAVTSVAMGALLGLGLVALPAVFGLGLAMLARMQAGGLLLYLLLLPLCSAAGAALGAAAFFISRGLAPSRLVHAGGALIALLAGGLWLHIEHQEDGWRRALDEHPERIVKSLNLLTPIPVLAGLADPAWWGRYTTRSLGFHLPAPGAGLLYGVFLLAGTAYLSALAGSGYRRVAADPGLIEDRPREPSERDEAGREFYWKGFRNPVWTRELRTRLRSRETIEFIFLASIAVAAGAFVPLVLTAGDLSDPLRTAETARQVFFWLTMTLVGLVTLIAPGLTADAIARERSQGTLELLIGTALRPREILAGKLLGAVCVMLLLLSPSLPLFGLCYLFHGASGAQVLLVYGLVLVTVTVSSFIGLAQSSIHPRGGMAKFWAYALTALFVGFPGGVFWIAAGTAAPSADMRQELANSTAVSAILAGFWCLGLGLLWGNAAEQLEYSEA